MEDYLGSAIFHSSNFENEIDKTGIWSVLISIAIPTIIVMILLKSFEHLKMARR